MEYETLIAIADALEEQLHKFIPEASNPQEAMITSIILIQSSAFRNASEKIKPIDPAGPYMG